MANNILYISDGDYGAPAGYILPLVQGQYGQSIPLEIRDLAGNVASLTGYSTITGHKRKGGSVTAIVGTFTLSGTPTVAPQITWVVDEDDTGDYGTFALFLEITNGTITYTTHPVNLTITRDPAVNATAAAGLVGVTTAQKTLLATISGLTGLVKMAGGAASAILVKLNGTAAPTVNDDSGDGYSIGSIWVDTTNDNAYIATDVTVGAANWEQINGAGGASDVTNLTTTTGASTNMVRVAAAGGLEYRTVAQVLSDIGAQASDADLTAIAALSPTNDDIIQRKSGAWTNRTVAEYKTDLGISGTMTGGGVLATGGFTLTVPATGTAALLAVANTFTAAQTVTLEDAATNTATNLAVINHRSSGTPAASFGAAISFLLESSTTVDQDAALIEARWLSATHAARSSVLDLSAYYIGTKTSLQVYPSTSDSYAKLSWGSNADISIFRESNAIVISTFSGLTVKSWNGSAYANAFQIDGSTTAGNTRMLIYDVDNATVERVTVGIADSGGAGYKVLRIPN